MSSTVWTEQICEGYKLAVQELILFDGQPVHFMVRKPEKEFQVEKFPCSTLTFLYASPSKLRYNPNGRVRVTDIVNNTATYEEPAKPFDLTFQLDFWAKKQSQMDYMTLLWLDKYYRNYLLPVIDTGGVSRSVFVTQSMMSRMDSTSVSTKDFTEVERTFHSSLTLKCWVEIDNNALSTLPIVATVGIIGEEGTTNDQQP